MRLPVSSCKAAPLIPRTPEKEQAEPLVDVPGKHPAAEQGDRPSVSGPRVEDTRGRGATRTLGPLATSQGFPPRSPLACPDKTAGAELDLSFRKPTEYFSINMSQIIYCSAEKGAGSRTAGAGPWGAESREQDRREQGAELQGPRAQGAGSRVARAGSALGRPSFLST